MKLYFPALLLLAVACGNSSDAALEGGTVLGPCGSDLTCPAGALCVYSEGSCSAVPVCVETLASQCKSETAVAGCDGGTVYTRECVVGGSYATGPTPSMP